MNIKLVIFISVSSTVIIIAAVFTFTAPSPNTLLKVPLPKSVPIVYVLAYENNTEDWEREVGVPGLIYSGEKHVLNDVNFGVVVINTISKAIYDCKVEVTYKAANGSWAMVSGAVGRLEGDAEKQTYLVLDSPLLSKIEWGNTTATLLPYAGLSITAYGYLDS